MSAASQRWGRCEPTSAMACDGSGRCPLRELASICGCRGLRTSGCGVCSARAGNTTGAKMNWAAPPSSKPTPRLVASKAPIRELMRCFINRLLILSLFCPRCGDCPRCGLGLRTSNEGGEDACRSDAGTDQQRCMKAREKPWLHHADYALDDG